MTICRAMRETQVLRERRTGILAVILFALVALAPAAEGAPYSSVYVFGDSNSDSGRGFSLIGAPRPPYFEGRFSNGPTAVEVFASNLGLSGAQFVNYSVGGALTGHGNVVNLPALANTGLLDQFATFQSTHATADPDALYFVWAGDNDINPCFPSCSDAVIDNAVANLVSLVDQLSDLGARHFFVPSLYGGGTNRLTFSLRLRDEMALLAAANGDDIRFFGARTMLLQMVAPNNPYGFTHFSGDPCYTGNLLGQGGTLCSNPEAYVFWDIPSHLSAHAHEVFGDAFAAAVIPEPGSLALLGIALAGLGFARCRKLH